MEAPTVATVAHTPPPTTSGGELAGDASRGGLATAPEFEREAPAATTVEVLPLATFPPDSCRVSVTHVIDHGTDIPPEWASRCTVTRTVLSRFGALQHVGTEGTTAAFFSRMAARRALRNLSFVELTPGYWLKVRPSSIAMVWDVDPPLNDVLRVVNHYVGATAYTSAVDGLTLQPCDGSPGLMEVAATVSLAFASGTVTGHAASDPVPWSDLHLALRLEYTGTALEMDEPVAALIRYDGTTVDTGHAVFVSPTVPPCPTHGAIEHEDGCGPCHAAAVLEAAQHSQEPYRGTPEPSPDGGVR